MTISYLVHKSAIWGRPSREDWCQRGQLDQGWRVDSSDDSFTWLACWCWLSVGDQPGLRTRDLNSSPPGPFCRLLGLPHTMVAGFQEAGRGISFLRPGNWHGTTSVFLCRQAATKLRFKGSGHWPHFLMGRVSKNLKMTTVMGTLYSLTYSLFF